MAVLSPTSFGGCPLRVNAWRRQSRKVRTLPLSGRLPEEPELRTAKHFFIQRRDWQKPPNWWFVPVFNDNVSNNSDNKRDNKSPTRNVCPLAARKDELLYK